MTAPGSYWKTIRGRFARPTCWIAVGWCLASGCGQGPEKQNQRSEAMGGGGTKAVFEEITRPSGLDFAHQLISNKVDNIMKSDGAGGVVLDFDGDGYMDIYLVNSGPAPILAEAPAGTPRWPNRLYRNRGNGTLEDVTERAGVQGWGFGTTAAAADYDNDGRTDLLVVNFGGLILYHNEGEGRFKDMALKAGLVSRQAAISASFLDYDADGHLDLLVANYLVFDPAVKVPAGSQVPYPGPLSYDPEFNTLYRNRGDGTFEDVSEQAGVRIPGHRAMSVTALDFDLDGDQDLYVSNDGTPNLLLANNGQGRFEDVAMRCGAAFDQSGVPGGSMGAAVGDCNGDGLPDMLVTRFGIASLFINSPNHLFEDRITASGILNASSTYVGWGGGWIDFDNDGDLDAFIANGDPHSLAGMPSLLLENDGSGRFVNLGEKAGPFFKRAVNLRGCGVLDLDNDGWRDVVLTGLGGPAVLLRNRGAFPHHWLTVQLAGTRCNRDGFGAWVKVVAGERTLQAEARCPTSYVFQHDPRLHFGLGSSPRVDRVEIRWPKPSGRLQVLTDVAMNQVLRVQEPQD